MNPSNIPGKRPIRSFVLRQGRITLAQNAALENLWPVSAWIRSDPSTQRRRLAQCAVGAGNRIRNGESLAEMAAAAPERIFSALRYTGQVWDICC